MRLRERERPRMIFGAIAHPSGEAPGLAAPEERLGAERRADPLECHGMFQQFEVSTERPPCPKQRLQPYDETHEAFGHHVVREGFAAGEVDGGEKAVAIRD